MLTACGAFRGGTWYSPLRPQNQLQPEVLPQPSHT